MSVVHEPPVVLGRNELRGWIAGQFTPDQPISNWSIIYRELFGLNHPHFGRAVMPSQSDTDQIVAFAKGLSPKRVFAACERLFPCSVFGEKEGAIKPAALAESITWSQRQPNSSYVLSVRGAAEADAENEGLSGEQLLERGSQHMTLVEYMLRRIYVYCAGGSPMDTTTHTLCMTRRSDGRFFSCHSARENPDMMCITTVLPHYSGHGLRARNVQM